MNKVKVALNAVMIISSIVTSVCGIVVKTTDLASMFRSK